MPLTLEPEIWDALLEIGQRECCGMDDLIEEASDLTPDAPLNLALCLFAIQFFRSAASAPANDAISEAKHLC